MDITHKKKWNVGVVQVHLEPPPTPLIKNKHEDKSDKDFVKLKLRRDLTSDKSDLYEFKIALFDNGNPEKLLLFVRNLNMTLVALGTLETAVMAQYLHTFFREKRYGSLTYSLLKRKEQTL